MTGAVISFCVLYFLLIFFSLFFFFVKLYEEFRERTSSSFLENFRAVLYFCKTFRNQSFAVKQKRLNATSQVIAHICSLKSCRDVLLSVLKMKKGFGRCKKR